MCYLAVKKWYPIIDSTENLMRRGMIATTTTSNAYAYHPTIMPVRDGRYQL